MLQEIVNLLVKWKIESQEDCAFDKLYLFGSSINNEGLLFDPKKSDIDIVITMPESLNNAVERTRWLESLLDHKLNLELEFVKLLKRSQTTKPIVSIIPLSKHEILADIHKSGVRDFFQENIFFDIDEGISLQGLINKKEVKPVDDLVRQLFEFSQFVRNKYLGVGFILTKHPLEWDSDDEAAPKELLRTTALAAYIENGKVDVSEKTALNIGLSHLTSFVYQRRYEDLYYKRVYDWIGKRTLKKGEQKTLVSNEYLFIAEIIFDMALSLQPSNVEKSHDHSNHQINSTALVDTSKAIPAVFNVEKNALIKGLEEEINNTIVNAGINLAWKTAPFFDIHFEEMSELETKIIGNEKDGLSIDRIRKLTLLKKDLLIGFNYIIYYQNYLFRRSEDKLSDISSALRSFCLLKFSSVFVDNSLPIFGGGFLEAYFHDYANLSARFPNVKFNAVINFGLPQTELDRYFKEHEYFKSLPKKQFLAALASENQPLTSISPIQLAQSFVPNFIDRLVQSGIDPISTNPEIERFNNEITNLDLWTFGVN